MEVHAHTPFEVLSVQVQESTATHYERIGGAEVVQQLVTRFYDIMEASGAFGMVTFDRHLVGLYDEGQITQETAMAFASQRGIVGRGIDSVKSARGETTTDIEKLELDRAYNNAL